MQVACADTALYALSIDCYHLLCPLRTLHSLARPMHPREDFVDKVVSMSGTYFLALLQGTTALQQAVHVSFLKPSFLLMYDHVECNICGNTQ